MAFLKFIEQHEIVFEKMEHISPLLEDCFIEIIKEDRNV
jgi:hypothetical protein